MTYLMATAIITAIVALELGYRLGAMDRRRVVIGSNRWWRTRPAQRAGVPIQGARGTIQRHEDAERGDLWDMTIRRSSPPSPSRGLPSPGAPPSPGGFHTARRGTGRRG